MRQAPGSGRAGRVSRQARGRGDTGRRTRHARRAMRQAPARALTRAGA